MPAYARAQVSQWEPRMQVSHSNEGVSESPGRFQEQSRTARILESKSKAMKIIRQVFCVGQVAVFLHVFWSKTGMVEVLMFT